MVTRKKKHVTPKNAISAKQVGEDSSPIDDSNTNDQSFTGQREGKCKAQASSEKVTPITAHVPSSRCNKGKGKSVHSKSPTLNSLFVPTLLSKDIPVFSMNDVIINEIQADPTSIWGWYNPETMAAWRNIFPLTEKSKTSGLLDLSDPAWIPTLNPWWYFLMDQPRLPPLEATTSRWFAQALQPLLSELSLIEL
ncbi:hypothetical protein FCV25MIE_10279 [Fagus crenata]